MATPLDKFRAIVSLVGNREEDQALVYLASEGINRITEQGIGEHALQTFLNSKLDEAQVAYEQAQITEAKLKLESIIELYAGNQEVAPLVDEAQRRLDEINAR